MYIPDNFDYFPMHRACISGSGLRVLNCLCCTVLQVDTIVINVVRGDCPLRFLFCFFKWCFTDFSACLWTGKSYPAAVQLLVVPWEHLIKCGGFCQLRVRILILRQILFSVVSQQDVLSVGRGLKSDSRTFKVLLLLSGMLNVEYNLILNPL